MRRRKTEKTLRPVHANAGIRAAYRRKLLSLVDEMARSYIYWIKVAYRETPPELAMDETRREREMKKRARQRGQTHKERRKGRQPVLNLKTAVKSLADQWQKNFDEAAPKLARYFASSIETRSRGALKKILKDGGWSVEFKLTAPVRDVLGAVVAENVSLIRSIPQQFHTQVEGMVMRSVTIGRDLEQLTRDLQHQFGVTRRRAEFIALDQNNKATAAITRVRYVDMGIKQAIWMHSFAGKKPRKTHLAAGKRRQVFNIAEGWYDPDPKVRRYIQAGELPGCKCTFRPVIKGFT